MEGGDTGRSQSREVLTPLEISERLTVVGLECNTREDVIGTLAERLETFGFVRPSYRQAVLDREREMPTGLLTKAGCVAIPHTDCEHVIRSAIAVALLARPIAFKSMAAPEDDLPVIAVLLLAVADKSHIVGLLANLANMFLDPQILTGLLTKTTPADVASYLGQTLSLPA
jgi:PTS system galactitol-specific IIA component